jgi:energy-coupling factor transporter ATP-binding protein EcfA2
MIEDRYGEFITPNSSSPVMELDVELIDDQAVGLWDSQLAEYDDVRVYRYAGRWVVERGGSRAEWDPQQKRGWLRQRENPYAIDGLLRILHSLMLASTGGFLVHAASAVRNGRAYVFAGVSGTGKTTLARLAPPDVTLLTDEISYVKKVSGVGCQVSGDGSQQDSRTSVRSNPMAVDDSGTDPQDSLTPNTSPLTPAFAAFGTPFAGELARIGRKACAPLETLFLLQQGPEHRIESVSEADAVRELLRHVLFFAQDPEMVRMIFDTVCEFVTRVPVRRLVFAPDARVWELIA